MRIFITGGLGYIGSRATNYLVNSMSNDIIVIDDLHHGYAGLLLLLDEQNFEFIHGNILTEESQPKIDAVVHLAAIVGERACDEDPKLAREINVEGTRRLLSQYRGMRFIYVSTCSVYGVNGLATEESSTKPLSLYAETKLDAEKLVLNAGGMVLRLGTICGISPRMRYDLFVNHVARSAILKDVVGIYGGAAFRPFVHVKDIGPAIQQSLANYLPGITNIVAMNLRKEKIIEIAQNLYPSLRTTTEYGEDKRDYSVSAVRMRNKLGFWPEGTVTDALQEVGQLVRLEENI